MKHRDSFIAAYYNPLNKKVYCRLCVTSNVRNHVVFNGECTDMECCSHGSRAEPWINKKFNFDNTKHKIIISEKECSYCEFISKECIFKTKNQSCPYYIKEITKDFASIIDNIPRKES